MRRALPSCALLAALLAGCAADPYDREPDQSTGAQWDLPAGSFYTPLFETAGASRVRAHVEVLNGTAPIGAFLASGAECTDYPTPGEFTPAAQALSTTNGTLEADLPAGRGCLILDNQPDPIGASPGDAPVTVAYRIEVWRRG